MMRTFLTGLTITTMMRTFLTGLTITTMMRTFLNMSICRCTYKGNACDKK
jgi:hypothetical protein